jgi:nicotinamide-nucleotide adenylyltransferase
LATHVLCEVSEIQKGLSATDVRRRMAQNKPWENMVPPAVAKLMKQWHIPDRLRDMGKASQ